MKQILSIIAMNLMLLSVSFSQPRNVYDIYALEYLKGSSRTPASVIAPGADPKDSVDFSYFIWYLNGDNGRKVLVDAGMLEDRTKSSNYLNYVRPDLMLKRINVNVNDITDIIITHPHSDHINGLELFPTGTIWMQKKDFAYFVGDAWQKGANHLGLDKQDVKCIIQANLDGRLQLVDGDSIEIIPGIRVFIGSRHTFESQHLLVDSNAGKVLLASDDSWFYYNSDHFLSIPLTSDKEAYAKELRRMKILVGDPRLIIPGHDALVLERFKKVAEGVVRIQ